MTRKRNLFFIASALILLAFAVTRSSAAAVDTPQPGQNAVKIYFFWGNGCPHCAHEKVFLDAIKKRYPQIIIESYEVWQNPANARFFSRMTQSANIKSTGVPVTFIDRKVFVGFSDREKAEMEKTIQSCVKQQCIDPADRLTHQMEQEIEKTIELPFLGVIDQSRASLPMITVILGGLDSFNPCAFFVLFFCSAFWFMRARERA